MLEFIYNISTHINIKQFKKKHIRTTNNKLNIITNFIKH